MRVASTWKLLQVGLLASFLGGCFQADLHATLMPDASGKLELELSVHRAKLPFFIKNPLKNLDSPHTMRRNQSPGIVAWGEPRRREAEGWERLTLTAYFEDINNLRFYKKREGEPTRILAFHFEPPSEDRVVRILSDLEPELTSPIPLDKLSSTGGVEVDPGMVRRFLPALRPLLGDVKTTLRVTAPGPLMRASGFGALDGNTASYSGDRDDFIASIQDAAGALVDADSLVADNPEIRWTEDQVEDEAIEAFAAELAAAKAWWSTQWPPRQSAN